MSLLAELKSIAEEKGIAVETGVFTGTAPSQYLVLTPLIDLFQLHADNLPSGEVQEVRISLYVQGSYTKSKTHLSALIWVRTLP